MFSDPSRLHLETHQGIQAASGNWYRHVEILGSGGNAITALVVSTSPAHRGTLFALKVFKRLAQPKRRRRFQAETEFLQTCGHPSVMRIFDTGLYRYTWNGKEYEYPFIVAEYLPKTLADVMREGTISLPERISYLIQLLSALNFLHTLQPPIVHRDIKPSNIFVKGNSCVLGDFGLLKVLGRDVPADPKFYGESLDGKIPWLYRSPDLVTYARGEGDLTSKSDVYQAGLVACELFTGHVPIAAPKQMLEPIRFTGVPYIPGAFGRRIATLIERMLCAKVDDRLSAAQLLTAFEKLFWESVSKVHDLEGHAFRKHA